MKVNSNLKRLYGLALICTCPMLYTACAGSSADYNVSGLDVADSGVMADQEQSRYLLNPEAHNVGLELVKIGDADQLIIRTGGDVEYKTTRLSAPDRLVLDLMNVPVGVEELVETPESRYLTSVQTMGIDADKSSIIFELNPEMEIVQDITRDGEAIVLSLSSQEKPFELTSNELEKETLASAEELAGPMPTLTDIALKQIGQGENMIIASLKSPGLYTLEKTTQSEYVLNLEGAVMQGSPSGVIAPKGTGKIRSVRPVQQSDRVQLRIFAEPNTMLTVKPQGNTLQVVAQEEFAAINLDEARAQADSTPAEDASESELEEFFAVDQKYTGRLISLDLQDTEIDNALRIIAEVSNLNIIASDDVTGKVTLRLIDVPWDQALDVILKTNGLDMVQEGNVVRIAPVDKLRAEREALKQARQAEEELEPLKVSYIRVSYAKAEELTPIVETVLTERGTVIFDERSNQLIVKDIRKGLTNVALLVQKLDLRTPQVLIETQIVEAQRTFLRELGSELGLFYLRSPETGNPTSFNFPNSIEIGGSSETIVNDQPVSVAPNVSFFPADNVGSAISMLLGSADGSKGLRFRLSQAEREGRVRVISSPSVAVTNNTPAVIKSVEKIRIKLPNGGVSVATGQGASSQGGGSVATEVVEIGIVLNVTAQASPDYYVLLDIEAKSSTFGNPQNSVDNIPTEIERSATSSVLISSGQTFAMGGIYRITENSSVDGVPFFKDIPVVGHLFRNSLVNDSDEELLFFITPRIVEGSFDDAAMAGGNSDKSES